MRKYVCKRLILAVPVVLGVATLVFLFIHLIPGDPIQIMLGENAAPVHVEEMRRALGLDLPLAVQYGRFLSGLVRGDMGRSIISRQPVVTLVLSRFPATIQLAMAAMAVAVCLAIPLGVLSAVKVNSRMDRAGMLFALLGISMPNFW
ncbi:ABC transporter permease, partial [bacterium]|nr:ABC transporter permease [candidate division CSSED10-310 bacterium]